MQERQRGNRSSPLRCYCMLIMFAKALWWGVGVPLLMLLSFSDIVAPPSLRWPQQMRAAAIELSVDADMVRNIHSANETATRFSSTDYVDLTCKVRRCHTKSRP